MGKFSKLWGALIGAVIGILAAFGIDTEWFTPELQSVVVGVLSAASRFLAPANITAA